MQELTYGPGQGAVGWMQVHLIRYFSDPTSSVQIAGTNRNLSIQAHRLAMIRNGGCGKEKKKTEEREKDERKGERERVRAEMR